MARFPTLRDLIDLIEGKKNKAPAAKQEWKVVMSNIFDETLRHTRRIFPDIDEKLGKFVQTKLPNPLDPNNRYGKHDRPCTHELSGFMHCHLRDDAILIYSLANHALNLIAVVSHADIEGKRLKQTAKRMKSQVIIGKPW